MPARPIFRQSALEEYRRRTARDVVPRLVSTPIVACLWALVATLAGAVVMAWSVRVPTYAAATGAVLGPRTAVLFVPPARSARLRAGRPVQIQIGSSVAHASGVVAKVQPRPIGPDAARERYRLHGGADAVTQPSTAVTVRLDHALPAAAYGGSSVTARVQTGAQRLLALLAQVAAA
jgi:hypothetical protein